MSSIISLNVFRIEHMTKKFGPIFGDVNYSKSLAEIDFFPMQAHPKLVRDKFDDVPLGWVFASRNINYLYNIFSYDFLVWLHMQGMVMRKYDVTEYVALDSEVIFNPSSATELATLDLL